MIKYTVKKQGIIPTGKGYVLRGMKASDEDFLSFGEVYFSVLAKDEIRGWKRHKEMTCNLLVLEGNVKFVVGSSESALSEITLGQVNHSRLTIPPGLWFGFKGLEEKNILTNIASIEHDPDESESQHIKTYKYNWC